jgi:DNA polymerase I-like protein with 3'-5' exonuclease and polymerase domains
MKQITNIQIHHELPPLAQPKQLAAWDVEMFNMQKKRLHRPHGKFASIAVTYDGINVYIIQDEALISEFFNRMEPAVWVGHNIAFDIRQMSRWVDIKPRKAVWDTMLVEQVRFRGYYDDFGLADLARRYCGLYLDKTEQKKFGTSDVMSDEQIEYAARDVAATWLVAQEQRKQIDKDDLRIWQEIEKPTMWMLQSVPGVMLDSNRWMEIATTKGDAAQEIFENCEQLYGFNIRSTKKLLEYLQGQGFKIESTDVATLSALKGKHPLIDAVLTYRKPQKGASTYGMKWLEKYVEADGRVWPSWNQIGTRTGRYSCTAPAMQTIPVRENPEYRDCFVAAPGHGLIVADYSSQEPRITAFFSQDEKLMSIFTQDKDIYCDVGLHVFGEEFDKKDSRRKDMKALVLGLSYGMTKYGLAEKLGAFPADVIARLDKAKTDAQKQQIKVDYAEYLMDRFFQEFPGVKKYINDAIEKAKSLGYVTTIMGRKCWISPYESGLERDAPNYAIQGCLSGDAQIFVDGLGLLGIGDAAFVVGNERVRVWDGTQFAEANILPSGDKKEYEIEFFDGSKIRCSDSHRFLLASNEGRDSWKTIAEFPKQAYIRTSAEIPDWSFDLALPDVSLPQAHNANVCGLADVLSDREIGIFVGRIASDGHVRLNKSVQITIAEHEQDVLDVLLPIMGKFGTVTVYERDNSNKPNARQWVRSYSVGNSYLARQLSNVDLKETIPYWIFSSKKLLSSYLCGLFDGDGTVSNAGNVSISFANKPRKIILAQQIRHALTLFGISSTIKQYGSCVRVCIPNKECATFEAEIGFLSIEKRTRLRSLVSAPRSSYGKTFGRALHVRAVRETGRIVPMYDVVNSSTGQFMANGLITHNSAADMMKLAAAAFSNFWIERYGYNPIVLFVHDEVVLEVDEEDAEQAAQDLDFFMVEAAQKMTPGVPGKAEVAIGDKWSAKK